MLTERIKRLLKLAQNRKATDIHICAGAPILHRIGRDLIPITDEIITPEQSKELSFELMTDDQIEKFEKELDFDLMIYEAEGRYRINISYNDSCVGAVIRILPGEPKTINELHLPSIVTDLCKKTKGLILLTGSTSQGKTTTLSAMIEEINRTQKKHIITIEDPTEYSHKSKEGIVRQREVGRDTLSFARGLRAALRQDPDVIAIGEMRDYETVRIALIAAETGVLIISTLHIISIDKIIERLVSYAPAQEENHIRYLLADSLQGIIHQELLPTIEGGKRVATEVMVVTDAVRNVIRRRGAFLLRNIITTGSTYGMITMNSSVNKLQEEGLISEDIANLVLENYRR